MKTFAIPFFLFALACNSQAPPEVEPIAQEAQAPAWPYEALSADERAVIDRGRDVAGWQRFHRELAGVVLDNARRAAGAARGGR